MNPLTSAILTEEIKTRVRRVAMPHMLPNTVQMTSKSDILP
jgi:hypothetical protein